MATIRAYTGYSERSNTHYYRDFKIVDSLPEVGEIVYGDDNNKHYGECERVKSVEEVQLDCEQGNDDVYNYDYYCATTQFEEYNEEAGKNEIIDSAFSEYYYAVKRGDID